MLIIREGKDERKKKITAREEKKDLEGREKREGRKGRGKVVEREGRSILVERKKGRGGLATSSLEVVKCRKPE